MKKLFPLFLCIITYVHISAQIITNPERLADIEKMLHTQQEILGSRSEKVFGFLHDSLTISEMQAMKFLYAYMPLSDLADYDNDFFLRNIQYSLRAYEEIPWARTIPEDEFLHFVLPVRVNNETLDTFRVQCYKELRDRVKGLSMYDAALEVNHWCHEKVTYKGSDERTSSPLNTMKYSFGRCGEESVFTVAALRAVGIPARQVYTPRWAHSDDNHAWVEVWIDGTWYYLGACEPEPELNMGWFTFPASRTMLVHTRAYGKYFGTEEVITEDKRFSELNLISNYAETKTISIIVTDSFGNPYPNAWVDILLYNYAEFFPIAGKQCNNEGETTITLGLGDVIIWATDGHFYNFKHVTISETDTVLIQIDQQHDFPVISERTLTPPVGKFSDPYPIEKQNANKKRLIYEDSLRSVYMTSFKDSLQSIEIVQFLEFNPVEIADFIKRSYGNHQEIIKFLEITPMELRHQAFLLLSVISEKDLRDATAEVLSDHLLTTAAINSEWYETDIEIYKYYILNGRIANEHMTAWRSFLKDKMTFEFSDKMISPALIEQWVKENISIDNIANMHSRTPLSPRGVYELRVADSKSRDIFFVAVCRSFGFPARLHPETKIPQYFFVNQWNNVWFEKNNQNTTEAKGTVFFTNPTKSVTDKYYGTFTLARIVNGRMITLEYEWDLPLTELEHKAQEVFAGEYALIKGRRLQDGTVISQLYIFQIQEGETVNLNANAPELPVSKMNFGKINLKHIKLTEFETNQQITLKENIGKTGMLLVFIDPDKEPSKHVMHDLALVKPQLEESGLTIFFILSPKNLSFAFSKSMFKGLPEKSRFLLDKNDELLNLVTKKSSHQNLPVVCLISPKQKILFLSNGYRIGTGDEILRLLK